MKKIISKKTYAVQKNERTDESERFGQYRQLPDGENQDLDRPVSSSTGQRRSSAYLLHHIHKQENLPRSRIPVSMRLFQDRIGQGLRRPESRESHSNQPLLANQRQHRLQRNEQSSSTCKNSSSLSRDKKQRKRNQNYPPAKYSSESPNKHVGFQKVNQEDSFSYSSSSSLESIDTRTEITYLNSASQVFKEQELKRINSKIKAIKTDSEDKSTQVDPTELLCPGVLSTHSMPMKSMSSLSTAKSFAYRVHGGFKKKKTPWSTHSLALVLEEQESESLHDVYLDEIERSGEKQYEPSTSKNIRAKLGCFQLFWHDFKLWRRRKMRSGEDIPVFRPLIKTIEGRFGSGIVSYFVFTRWLFLLNLLLAFLWLAIVTVPTAIHFDYNNFTKPFYIKDLLNGKNALAESWMFFGSYSMTHWFGWYCVPLAYCVMILVTYFGSLFIILRSIVHAMEAEVSHVKDTRHTFSHLLFSSWDFSLTSEEAIMNRALGITNVLRDQLSEVQTKHELGKRTRKEKCWIIARRCLAWLITIILIGAGCTTIFFLVVSKGLESVLPESLLSEDSFLSNYGVAIIFSLINIIVPLIVNWLPSKEHYLRGRTELNIKIARVFVLRMANLGALIISLYEKVKTPEFSGCAGTAIGQALYRLVIVDSVIQGCTVALSMYGTYYWTNKRSEFNMAQAVLTVVYRQALIWTGTLACPVLPIIGMLSNLLFFLLYYKIVMTTCKPPSKRWNQSKHSTFFMGLLAATLILLLVPVSVIIGSANIINLGHTGVQGEYCGPFGGARPIDIFSQYKDTLPEWINTAMEWITSTTVVLPTMFIMMALIYFQGLRVKKEKQKLHLSAIDLDQERSDNKELVKKLHALADVV